MCDRTHGRARSEGLVLERTMRVVERRRMALQTITLRAAAPAKLYKHFRVAHRRINTIVTGGAMTRFARDALFLSITRAVFTRGCAVPRRVTPQTLGVGVRGR